MAMADGLGDLPVTRLYHGDCLQLLPLLSEGSVDMVFADMPYGTTYAKWDRVLPMDTIWTELFRICKENAAMLFTSSQPFTSALVQSNPKMFSCEWIWDKVNPTNFANAKKQPMKSHESVVVFSRKQPVYNPQKVPGKKNHSQGTSNTNNYSETRKIHGRVSDDTSGLKYPKSIQTFAKHSSQCGLHPTQKPVDMLRYFIRTYTNPNDVVLDFCMGSGSTGEAAVLEGRRFIGMEKDEKYFNIARDRICTLENDSG